MRHRLRVDGLVVILCAVALGACGGSGDSSSAGGDKGVPDSAGDVPFDLLTSAIMKANKGDNEAAAEFLDPRGPMRVDGAGRDIPTEQIWDYITHTRTVKSVEKVTEQYSGERVSVGYLLHYSQGDPQRHTAGLIKVDGRWKIHRLSNDIRGFN